MLELLLKYGANPNYNKKKNIHYYYGTKMHI